MAKNKLELIYRPLNEIKPLPGNAKLHDLDEIMASIRTHGFIDPIGVNPETMHDLDGNGRLQALKTMFAGGEPPPKHVIAGTHQGLPCWLAPTVNVSVSENMEGILALRLNRSHDKGGYDKLAVLAVLEMAEQQGQLDQTGFDAHDLQHFRLLAKHSDPSTLDDFFREEPGKPGKEENVKLVFEYSAERAEQVREALLQHGDTLEEALEALLGL